MTKSEKRKYCYGCKDEFYMGNNPYGIQECWHLKSARLVLRKEVHINQVPPWKQKPEKYPSCYKRPHYIYVDKNAEY